MYETINEHLRDNFYNNPAIASMLAAQEREVLQGKATSFSAAKKLLDTYFRNPWCHPAEELKDTSLASGCFLYKFLLFLYKK